MLIVSNKIENFQSTASNCSHLKLVSCHVLKIESAYTRDHLQKFCNDVKLKTSNVIIVLENCWSILNL